MKALILAAGLGTRLRPFTLARAKPSLPVLGVPTLWFGAWHLERELAPDSFVVNLSHAPESVRAAAEDRELSAFTGVRFEYSDESAGILGSSGALWKIRSWIGKQTLAVCNGDSISLPSWRKMAKAHRDSGALITLHARSFSSSNEAYTNLVVDASSRVTAFGPKSKSGVMFAGSYLIEPEAVGRLPAGVSELRPQLLEPLAREGKLQAYREDGPWFDTGDVRSFAEAQFGLLGALPSVRALVESKMRETAPGCWVPRGWEGGGLSLKGPVVLLGAQREWLAASPTYGPRFVGLAPPASKASVVSSDAVVMSEHVERL